MLRAIEYRDTRMAQELLPSVEIAPETSPAASIIWLHGLGADGHDFIDIIPQLRLPKEAGVRFVFPHAPRRPVTINGGYVMRAWYDIFTGDIPQREDEQGIRASARMIQALIQREIEHGIPAHRIVLAGFSQGGAIALHTGLRQPQRLAGILALSTYLPLHTRLRAEAHPANADIPIMMMHGTQDTVIPMVYGEMSCKALREAGYPVEWRSYPMPHALCAPQIQDISDWLRKVLGV